MPRCLVSLGSNLGERQAALDAAVEALTELAVPGTLRSSSRHETVPVGGPAEQGTFANAVVRFHSQSKPHELLSALQKIERSLDRERPERWAARTLDLDLLLYGEEVIRTPDLCVPHPRMTFRPFVLQPACEVASDWRHPECDLTLAELLSKLRVRGGKVRLVGDSESVVRAVLSEERPEILPAAESPACLTIDTTADPYPLAPSGPRLVLADCPREHWRDEVLAAVECVWPTEP